MSTHTLRGLSINDFVVAAKIDSLEVDFSPKWLQEQQAAMQTPQA
jgi:4a-hydroxytetrahydrobiopterin dehydratase